MGTRDKIKKTAQNLFAQRGYDGVSVREIASQAGVNISAVSYHFGGKEQLLRDVMREGLVDFRSTISEIGDEALPLKDKIELLLDAFLEFLHRKDSVSRIMFFELSMGGGRIPDIVGEHFSWVTSKFSSLLQDGVQRGEIRVTDELLTTLQFVSLPVHLTYARPIVEMMRGQQGYSRDFLKQVTRHITDVMFHGLSTQNAQAAGSPDEMKHK